MSVSGRSTKKDSLLAQVGKVEQSSTCQIPTWPPGVAQSGHTAPEKKYGEHTNLGMNVSTEEAAPGDEQRQGQQRRKGD